jgi:hypothetical protein
MLKSPNIKRSDKNSIVKTVYKMHDDDLRGTFWDHILVFGSFEHLVIMLKSFA